MDGRTDRQSIDWPVCGKKNSTVNSNKNTSDIRKVTTRFCFCFCWISGNGVEETPSFRLAFVEWNIFMQFFFIECYKNNAYNCGGSLYSVHYFDDVMLCWTDVRQSVGVIRSGGVLLSNLFRGNIALSIETYFGLTNSSTI